MVNAAALPGGQVLVFSELIDEAASADELAGVLAHEFGHVDRWHPNKALIRQFGLSLFVGAVGGNAGNTADQLLLLRGSRAAETEADAEAIAILRRAQISPAGSAAFFDRQQRDAERRAKASDAERLLDRIGSYAATHPADADRAARFRAAGGGVTRPALDAADWAALRGICRRTG